MKVPNQLRCGARILLVLSVCGCERIGFTLVDADAGRVVADAGPALGTTRFKDLTSPTRR